MGHVKAQLSAEMLILIVVILAVIAMAASQLFKTTEKTGQAVENQGNVIIERSEAAVKAKSGEFCTDDKQCLSNNCDEVNYQCV